VSLMLEGEKAEVLEIELAPVHQAAVNYHHGVCCIGRMCTFVCGDLEGIADFEATANLHKHYTFILRLTTISGSDSL
jgi:hypothetical protein